MFLALTLIMTLLEISFSKRRRSSGPRLFSRIGRTGLHGAHQGTDEYLDGDDCDPKIYDCDDYSYEESNVTPPPKTDDDCDTQIYDCNNYSYEESIATPPPNNGNGR